MCIRSPSACTKNISQTWVRYRHIEPFLSWAGPLLAARKIMYWTMVFFGCFFLQWWGKIDLLGHRHVTCNSCSWGLKVEDGRLWLGQWTMLLSVSTGYHRPLSLPENTKCSLSLQRCREGDVFGVCDMRRSSLLLVNTLKSPYPVYQL